MKFRVGENKERSQSEKQKGKLVVPPSQFQYVDGFCYVQTRPLADGSRSRKRSSSKSQCVEVVLQEGGKTAYPSAFGATNVVIHEVSVAVTGPSP